MVQFWGTSDVPSSGGYTKRDNFLKIWANTVHSFTNCFFSFNNVRDIPSDQQTGQVIFSAMCYVCYYFFTDGHFSFPLICIWPCVLVLYYCKIHSEAWDDWLDYVWLYLFIGCTPWHGGSYFPNWGLNRASYNESSNS